jgi:kynureninase
MAALEAAIDLWLTVDQEMVWQKSRELSELMVELVDDRCRDLGVSLASPLDPYRRGSHIALRHPEAHRVKLALIDRGVIGDFRPPDVMRFAITPLYLRHTDIWDAVNHLVDVLRSGAHDAGKYAPREKVT